MYIAAGHPHLTTMALVLGLVVAALLLRIFALRHANHTPDQPAATTPLATMMMMVMKPEP